MAENQMKKIRRTPKIQAMHKFLQKCLRDRKLLELLQGRGETIDFDVLLDLIKMTRGATQ